MDNQKEINELGRKIGDCVRTDGWSQTILSHFLYQEGYRKQSQEQKIHACKCRNGKEVAMTVIRLDEGLSQCPRCGGIIIATPQRKVSVEDIWEVMKNSWKIENGSDRDERFYVVAQAIYNLIERRES